MMTAKSFADYISNAPTEFAEHEIESRDAAIRAEEHEARQALFALERAAHKRELREVRAAALREAARDVVQDGGPKWATISRQLMAKANRAERGES